MKQRSSTSAQIQRWPGPAPAATPGAFPRWSSALFIVALTGAVVLAYLQVWHGGFIWDDDTHLLNNPVLGPGGLARTWMPGGYLNYWPLTFTIYWLEFHAWGINPLSFHLVNVALHILAALLVWRVLLRLGLGQVAAMLAAAVFALHPVAVEAVAWVTQTKTLLPSVLALLSTLIYLDYERRSAWWRYALAVAVFALATLARGMAVTLPLVLLMLAWWQRGRITWRDVIRVLPYGLIGLAMAVVEVIGQHHVAGGQTIRSDSMVARALTVGWAFWFYLGKLACPLNLIFVYPRWNVSPSEPLHYVPSLMLLALLVVGWLKRRTWGRPVLMVSISYLALLLPVLGFADIYFMRFSFVADHYQYLAMIVPIAGAAALVARGVTGMADRAVAWMTGAVAGAALLLMGALTFVQVGVYRNQLTLWRDVLAKNPTCWMAHNNLGRFLAQHGSMDAAARHFELALEFGPEDGDIRKNLGVALVETGHDDRAVTEFERALASKEHAHDPDTYYSMGVALLNLGRLEPATDAFDEAMSLHLSPRRALDAHWKLGSKLQDMGQYAQAIPHLEQALHLAQVAHQAALARDIQVALTACRSAVSRSAGEMLVPATR